MKKGLILFQVFLLLASCQLSPPSLSVKADGQALKVYKGSYCWDEFNKSECADTGGPADTIGEDVPKKVEADSEAVLSFRDSPEVLTVSLEGSDEIVELVWNDSEPAVSLPDEPGVYMYSVRGNWEQGDASYFFQIEVE